VKLETIADSGPAAKPGVAPPAAAARRVGRAWVWLGALLVLVLTAWAFDAWVLPLALAPAATDEQARAAEVTWWALTVLTAGAGFFAAAHFVPRALAAASATERPERPERRRD
jgi:Na+/proline symporter